MIRLCGISGVIRGKDKVLQKYLMQLLNESTMGRIAMVRLFINDIHR